MNSKFGLESRALREQALGGVEGIVDVHIGVIAADTGGEVLSPLPGLLAALMGHTHVNGVEDLIAEFLRRFGQRLREGGNPLDVGNYFLISSLDSLHDEPAHAIHDGGCCARVDTS